MNLKRAVRHIQRLEHSSSCWLIWLRFPSHPLLGQVTGCLGLNPTWNSWETMCFWSSIQEDTKILMRRYLISLFLCLPQISVGNFCSKEFAPLFYSFPKKLTTFHIKLSSQEKCTFSEVLFVKVGIYFVNGIQSLFESWTYPCYIFTNESCSLFHAGMTVFNVKMSALPSFWLDVLR